MSLFDLCILLLLTIVISAISEASANSVDGCGGFVEESSTLIKARKSSDPKLDYSQITVELQTIDGLVKDRAQCAPNGYYFIPVYDMGSFVVKVKGPDGWLWNPENFPVTVDQMGCNLNADINFQLTGFGCSKYVDAKLNSLSCNSRFLISGKVEGAIGGDSCTMKDGGPSGVKVDLLSSFGDIVSSVFTSKGGIYSFTSIAPGQYHLHASHPNMDIKLSGSSEVELGFGNVIIDKMFFVTGYDIHGFVAAQENSIEGVHMYLYSDTVSEINCFQGHDNALGRNDSLCQATSNADGKFTFKSVPCGVYNLLPYYKKGNTIFNVSPSSITISVQHQHVIIDEIFQVTGFSVDGHVIDDNGSGVNNVKIIVDGRLWGLTDNHGNYKLNQITSKHYTIEAKKEHYKFKSLSNVLVMPNITAIPDIEAVAYDVCGVVHFVTSNKKAKVTLIRDHENMIPRVKETDVDGKFCFEVKAGDYRLSAVAASSEDSSSVIFLPPYIDFVVKSPLINVEFIQAHANIYGTIHCLEKCNTSISISLTSLLSKSSNETKNFSIEDGNSDFMFPKLLPGKYQLEVKHNSVGANSWDDWCWNEGVVDVELSTEDKKGIIFVQKGYWVNVISTHDVLVTIVHQNSKIGNFQIKRGLQRLCIETPGIHELHFVDSCVSFGSQFVTFDTLNSEPIYLTGQKYRIKGEVQVTLPLYSNHSEMSKNILIDVLNKEFDVVATTEATFIHGRNSLIDTLVYEYIFWSNLGEDLVFVPQDTRLNDGKQILFYPRRQHVAVTNDGCQATVSPIVGRVGLYIEGSVSPEISDVNIKIMADGNNSNAALRQGELVLEVKTVANGSFIAGPLYDDMAYTVHASKAGYYLKSIGAYSFSCQKLSQVSVHIFDEEDLLFPPVLLSLSGDKGYRNNTVTGVGGHYTFTDLFPGSFYLRPLLKEYSFTPSMQAIELLSGECKEITFNATRVAYSVHGRVSLLSDWPKEDVYLEARSESKGYYEEARSDSDGNYRLRGLFPQTVYTIKVASKKNQGNLGIERTSPNSVIVEVGTEDVKGINFVVFEQPEMTILSGHVEGIYLDKLQPHLSVEIKSSNDPLKIESIFKLPLSYYFEIRDLPKGKHLVQLVSDFPASIYRFHSEVLEVDLDVKPQFDAGALRYNLDEYHQKQNITPAPVFPLIVGVIVIALFVSIPRLKDIYQMVFGYAASTSRKDARKPILRRRAY